LNLRVFETRDDKDKIDITMEFKYIQNRSDIQPIFRLQGRSFRG